jgi:TonB family protein
MSPLREGSRTSYRFDAGFREARYRSVNGFGPLSVVCSSMRATLVIARSQLPGPLVNYRCVTYTIVDQHLYRLVAYATGNDKRPPDYEAAVGVMSALTFVPLDQSSPPNTGTVTGLLKMPPPQILKNRDWYPPPAKRRGEEGVVDIEYSIDSKGRVRDIKETSSGSRTLQDAAHAFLTSTTFKVKPSWEGDGNEKLRFTTEVQFWLGRCPRNSPARTLGAEVVTICEFSMPR